jgi:dihydropteroate synthase
VADFGAGYIAMHMQGTPQTMQVNPTYSNVTHEVAEFFRERRLQLHGVGVAAEQVVLDVGLGFGKSLEHNLQLLATLESFTKLERPLLLGASRKSFIAGLHPAEAAERLPGSLACACLAVAAGVQIIRTHNVAETVQAVRVTEAILARRNI